MPQLQAFDDRIECRSGPEAEWRPVYIMAGSLPKPAARDHQLANAATVSLKERQCIQEATFFGLAAAFFDVVVVPLSLILNVELIFLKSVSARSAT
jgi:hypothetical protein